MRKLPIAFALVAACATLPAAADVYKCKSPQGDIAYQDKPCAKGDTQTKMEFAPAPEADTTQAEVPPPQTETPPPAPPPMPRFDVPPIWICANAEDGKPYMSRDGNPQPRLVPAGVLGIPGKSLAQAYGPGGIGVSAPGMRAIPVDKSPQAAVAGDYVAVQDVCQRATTTQACNYLQDEYDKVHQKLKRAFKDEQAILKPQEDRLSEDLRGCG